MPRWPTQADAVGNRGLIGQYEIPTQSFAST